MKIHKLIVSVLDFDQLGADGVKEVLENTPFANDCISPSVRSIETRDIGNWSDDNPLNKKDTADTEFERLFGKAQAAGAVSNSDDLFLLIRDWEYRKEGDRHNAALAIRGFFDAHAEQRYEAGKQEKEASTQELVRNLGARMYAAEASLARLVEGVGNLLQMTVSVGSYDHKMFLASDVLALLPAKAESEQQEINTALDRADDEDVARFPAPAMGEKPRWKGETVTCDCGEPTKSPNGQCAMCASDGGLFQPPVKPATPAPAMGEELRSSPKSADSEQQAGLMSMGEKLPPLPRWIDDAKGKDPFTDDLIAEIERLRACMALRQPGAGVERDGWDAAAKALSERAAGWDKKGNYTRRDECMQCASMLHDMKPAKTTPAAPVSQPAAQELPSKEKVVAIAEAAFRTGKLNEWSGFSQDADGRYMVPVVTGKEYALVKAVLSALYTAPPALSAPAGSEQEFAPDVSEMVNRFLGWKLPHNFSPDNGIQFHRPDHKDFWPIGTNLFTADEVRAMFLYCLGESEK